jgi:hypothetical protein
MVATACARVEPESPPNRKLLLDQQMSESFVRVSGLLTISRPVFTNLPPGLGLRSKLAGLMGKHFSRSALAKVFMQPMLARPHCATHEYVIERIPRLQNGLREQSTGGEQSKAPADRKRSHDSTVSCNYPNSISSFRAQPTQASPALRVKKGDNRAMRVADQFRQNCSSGQLDMIIEKAAFFYRYLGKGSPHVRLGHHPAHTSDLKRRSAV